MSNVTKVGHSGPSLSQHSAGVGVDLGEADGAPAGSLEAEVESSDAAEEAGMGKNSTSCTPVRVRLTSSLSNGPLPPPGLPSLILSRVGFVT